MSADVTPLRAVPGKGRKKPSTKELADQLAATYSYATGGQQVYVFEDGCYRPGERKVQQQAVELLGDGWSKRKADEIAAYLRITSPELWECPPLETINVLNGLLSVETRELRPHDPEHLSPIQINASYDPNADCPQIEAFLDSTIPDLIELFMEITGLLLTPDNRMQRAVMYVGGGGTGKSTAANLQRAIVGRENVSSVALHQLDEDRFASSDLYGRLVNIFADIPGHALKASSMFKSITGGDRIRAERKHRDAFDFTPYTRLLFSANEVPPTADASDAYFDRWVIVPFDQRHRNTEHQDHNLLAKLTAPAELTGLLNHALVGLARVHKQYGFSRVKSSEHAAERFRVDADSAAGFVEDCCTLEDRARIAKPALFEAYKAWCDENNRRPLASQRFSRRLREMHALDSAPSKGKDYWLGIALRDQ